MRYSTGAVNFVAATGSYKAAFEGSPADGFLIDVWTGVRPASPDDAIPAGCTLLATVSQNAGGNGVHFEGDAPVNGNMVKETSETWLATILANGQAGWFRIHRKTGDTGLSASSSAVRADGSIATAGADWNMVSTEMFAGAPLQVVNFAMAIPKES